jgi:hypothetical protein
MSEAKNTQKSTDKGMEYEPLLATVNFCTMPNGELMKILEFCGLMEVVDNSDMEQKIKGEECIEKRWSWYNTITVTPKAIKYAVSPYPSSVVMTAERYAKLKAF